MKGPQTHLEQWKRRLTRDITKINASEEASIRDIIQINESEVASIRDIIHINGSE